MTKTVTHKLLLLTCLTVSLPTALSHGFTTLQPNQRVLINSLNNINSTLFSIIKPENPNSTAITRTDLIDFVNQDYRFKLFNIKFNNPDKNYNIKLTKTSFQSAVYQKTIANFLSEKALLEEILNDCEDDHCISEITQLIQTKSNEETLDSTVNKNSHHGHSKTDNKNAFHFIASRGLSKIVKKICKNDELVKMRGLVSSVDTTGNTGLIYAAFNGHAETVEQILECNVLTPNLANHVNQGNHHDGMTALMYASVLNKPETVEKLLENEFLDVNQKTIEAGSTALMFAAEGGYVKVVEKLLESEKIDISAVNWCKPLYDGAYCKPKLQNAFMMAASWNRIEIVEMMIEHKDFSPEFCDQIDGHDNSTAMMLAASNDNIEILETIVGNDKCSKDVKNYYGFNVDDIAYLNVLKNVTILLNNLREENGEDVYEPTTFAWVARFSRYYFYIWLFSFNGFLPFTIVGYLFWVQYRDGKEAATKKEEGDEKETTNL